jgi:hypothetical protein
VDGSILKDKLRVDDIGLRHCGGTFETQLNEEIGRQLKKKGCECRYVLLQQKTEVRARRNRLTPADLSSLSSSERVNRCMYCFWMPSLSGTIPT